MSHRLAIEEVLEMNDSATLEEQFNKAFEKSVEQTLQSLGTSVYTAVMFHLERAQGVSTKDILKDPKIFSEALQKIFASGAKIIEDKVLQEMSRELGIDYEKTHGTFDQKVSVVHSAASKRAAILLN